MTKLNVPGMSCGHCKAAVEKAVAGVDPGAHVDVDLGTGPSVSKAQKLTVH